MRAREFISEVINPATIRPGFSKTQNMGAYTLKAYIDPKVGNMPHLRIDAIDNQSGALIGATYFEPKDVAGNTIKTWQQIGKNGNLEALMTNVNPTQQNKGIGSAMYNFARRLGNQINPSSFGQTAAGKAFWNSGAGVNKIGQQGPSIDDALKQDFLKKARAEPTAPVAKTNAGAQPNQSINPMTPSRLTHPEVYNKPGAPAAAPSQPNTAGQQNTRYIRDTNGNLIPNPQANVKAPATTAAPVKPTVAPTSGLTRPDIPASVTPPGGFKTPSQVDQAINQIRSQPIDWDRESRSRGYAGVPPVQQPQTIRPQTTQSSSYANSQYAKNIAADNERLAKTVAADNLSRNQNLANQNAELSKRLAAQGDNSDYAKNIAADQARLNKQVADAQAQYNKTNPSKQGSGLTTQPPAPTKTTTPAVATTNVPQSSNAVATVPQTNVAPAKTPGSNVIGVMPTKNMGPAELVSPAGGGGGGGAIAKGIAGAGAAGAAAKMPQSGDEYTNFYPVTGTQFQNQQYIKDLQNQAAKYPSDPNIKGELEKMQKKFPVTPSKSVAPQTDIDPWASGIVPLPKGADSAENDLATNISSLIPKALNSNDLIERKRK